MAIVNSLDNFNFEETSPRDQKNNKLLFTYDQSLKALKERKYERHLRPSEAFQILIDALEKPQSPYKPRVEEPLVEDMHFSYGEWLSLAMKREKDKLTFYFDPENLVWNGEEYEIKGTLNRAQECTFTIDKKLKSKTYIDLNQFPHDLQVVLYARPWDQLPGIMKTGSERAKLWLPPEGIIRPYGRGNNIDDFSVVGNHNNGASRGVRLRAPRM